jgi:TonB family protein
LDAARQWIGRALILRGFYAANDLTFNAKGQLAEPTNPKLTDWTLAGVNLEKVAGSPDGTLELEGTRVAIRYNPDQRQFERHIQKDEHVRIRLAASPTEAATNAALKAIFSTGMDPAFERSVPAPWLHYFLPTSPWPPDDLTNQTIYGINGKFPADVTDPIPEKKPEPSFTGEAQRDKVKGSVVVRMVVDRDGNPQHIVIVQPLGYGLDMLVVKAVSRYHFRPAMKAGEPVAAEVTLRQAFE